MSASTSTIRPSKPTSATDHAHADANSAHRSHVSQRRRLARSHNDTDRIQADGRCFDAMLPHPQRRELPQSPHLGEGDRLKGMAETKPTSALHLTEDQHEAMLTDLRGDNVDLTGYVGLVIRAAGAAFPRKLA
jgi:hypothetical protein